jgi:ABC-type transport system involved in multi-copper enzyme maturation permease subunit
MTAMTEPTAVTVPAYHGDQRVTPLRVLRSELTKFRTLASTAWSLLAATVLTVGIGVLYAMLRVSRPPQPGAAFDGTAVSLAGVQLAQFAVGILGVLLITGEHSTGMIRTSITAVPRRLPVLWAKAVTLGLVTLAALLPATLAAFLVGQWLLSAEHLDASLTQPGVVRAVLGSALYLAAVGLFGLGLGALLRNTAGAIGALFGALFGLQLLAALLPATWSEHVYKFLPTPAGSAISAIQPDRVTSLGPWTGFGVFCLYITVVFALAAWRLRRRDI